MINKESKCVYVASHPYTTLTKVGVSKNVSTRMKSLSINSGCDLTIYYESPPLKNATEIESAVLKYFTEVRTRGEWMNIEHEKVIEYIQSIQDHFNSDEYLPLYTEFEPDCPCIMETVVTSWNHLTKIEDFIYEDSNGYFYIKYQQGLVTKEIKICNLKVAKRFKSKYKNRLLHIQT